MGGAVSAGTSLILCWDLFSLCTTSTMMTTTRMTTIRKRMPTITPEISPTLTEGFKLVVEGVVGGGRVVALDMSVVSMMDSVVTGGRVGF